MYIDTVVTNKSTGATEEKRVRIQGTVLYFDTLDDFAKNVVPPYTSNVLYFIARSTSGDTTYLNALVRWDGTKWIQLNVTADNFAALQDMVNNHTTTLNSHTTKLDGHADRIEALETWKTGTVTTALESLNSDVSGLKTWKNTAETTLENHGTAIQGHTTSINGLVSKTDGHADRIGELESWKTTTVTPKITTLETKTGTLETKVGTLESWKETANTQINTNKTDIASLKNKNDAIEDRLDGVDETIELVNDRIDGIISDFEEDINDITNNQIAALRETVTGIGTTVNSHTTTIGQHTDQIQALQGTVGTHTSDISDLKGKVATNISDIAGLKTSVSTNTSNISGLDTSLKSLTSKVDGIEDDIGDTSKFSAIGADVSAAIVTLNNNINGVNSTVQSHDGRIKALEDLNLSTEIGAVKGRLDSAEANIRTLTTSLENLEDSLSEDLQEHIKAANAMRFRNDIVVNSAASFAKLTSTSVTPALNLSIGDTIVVTDDFYTGSGSSRVDYHAGDLLIIGAKSGKSENDQGILAPGDVAITKVDTGYGEAHDLILAGGENQDTKVPSVTLKDAVGTLLGTVEVKGFGNVVTALDNNTITVSMAWGAF